MNQAWNSRTTTVKVPQTSLTGMANRLGMIQDALDQTTLLPINLHLEKNSLTTELEILKTKTFPNQQQMNLTANKLAKEILLLGRKVTTAAKALTPIPSTEIWWKKDPLEKNPLAIWDLSSQTLSSSTLSSLPSLLEWMEKTAEGTAAIQELMRMSWETRRVKMTLQMKNQILQEEMTRIIPQMSPLPTSDPMEWVTTKATQLTSLLMVVMKERDHPDHLPLNNFLRICLSRDLILKEAREEVATLLALARPEGSRMHREISLDNLATLNRQITMKAAAIRAGTWPLLMRQTAHREGTMNSERLMEELTRQDQMLFLTTVPLKMLWI